MILAAAIVTLALSVAPETGMPLAVRIFKDACLDGSAKLSRPKKATLAQMGDGSRKSLFRASRIVYFGHDLEAQKRFKEIGNAYLVESEPRLYLIPQMPTDVSQSSKPVCVVLTKDQSAYWQVQRAVRNWGEPDKTVPVEQPGLKIGDSVKQGLIVDQTFEARIRGVSVAAFRESGWVVMRTLDYGDRPHPMGTLPGKKN